MAAKLGATFLVGALGPVNFAGGAILSSQVPEGLRELAAENLMGGMDRGIAQAARRVGVRPSDVERLLPMGEIRATIARIGLSQKNAVEAWNLHAGHLGGFMKGVADLTADGRAPDVGLCLERLARKMSRDKPLADPLQALAVDIEAWQDLIARSRDLLDDGAALKKAYQRRRIRQALLAIVPAVIAAAALAVGLWYRAIQARIDEALARPDPCAVLDLTPSDLSRSSGAQRKRVEELRAACQAAREHEAMVREDQARKEAQAREAERVKKEREDRCEALATHLVKGQLLPEDEATAGDKTPLLRRIAKGALDAGDLGPDDAALPCGDTPSGVKVVEAFSRAVLAAPAAWANAEDPSALVRATLVKHSDELPSSAKQVVAWRADKDAKRALFVGGPGVMERAVRLCALKDALGIRGGSFCSGIARPKAP